MDLQMNNLEHLLMEQNRLRKTIQLFGPENTEMFLDVKTPYSRDFFESDLMNSYFEKESRIRNVNDFINLKKKFINDLLIDEYNKMDDLKVQDFCCKPEKYTSLKSESLKFWLDDLTVLLRFEKPKGNSSKEVLIERANMIARIGFSTIISAAILPMNIIARIILILLGIILVLYSIKLGKEKKEHYKPPKKSSSLTKEEKEFLIKFKKNPFFDIPMETPIGLKLATYKERIQYANELLKKLKK